MFSDIQDLAEKAARSAKDDVWQSWCEHVQNVEMGIGPVLLQVTMK